LVYISSGGFILWAGTNVVTLNEKFYKKYVIPAFFACDPETAHDLLTFSGKYGLIPKSFYKDPPILVSLTFYHLFIILIISTK